MARLLRLANGRGARVMLLRASRYARCGLVSTSYAASGDAVHRRSQRKSGLALTSTAPSARRQHDGRGETPSRGFVQVDAASVQARNR